MSKWADDLLAEAQAIKDERAKRDALLEEALQEHLRYTEEVELRLLVGGVPGREITALFDRMAGLLESCHYSFTFMALLLETEAKKLLGTTVH